MTWNVLNMQHIITNYWIIQTSPVVVICHFKLCALFRSYLWIQTGVTVWKCSIWVKIVDFSARATFKLDRWPKKKTIRHLLYATASFVHHFVAICEFKLELQSANAQTGAKFVLTSVTLTFPWPFAWTSLLSMVITPESFMMIRWEEHCEKCVTDGQTEVFFLELLGPS